MVLLYRFQDLQEQHFHPKPHADVSDRLSESEVAVISQLSSIRKTAVKLVAKGRTEVSRNLEPTREQSPLRLGLMLFIDALVFLRHRAFCTSGVGH